MRINAKLLNINPQGNSMKHSMKGRHYTESPVAGVNMLLHRFASLTEWSLQSACEDFWRLICPENSGGYILHEDTLIPLKAGFMYLLTPNTKFDSRCEGQFNLWYTNFLVSGLDQGCRPAVIELEKTSEMRELLDRAMPSPESWPNQEEPDISAMDTLQLAFHVLKEALPEIQSVPHQDPRLQRCIEFLREFMGDKITLDNLSKQARVSQRDLSTIFRDGVGSTPMRYLLKLRINDAMRRLRHTDATVECIADSCGFPDRYYLTRMLKKYRDTTPAAFRNYGLRELSTECA
jgi:AraC-like DNA-binding protein